MAEQPKEKYKYGKMNIAGWEMKGKEEGSVYTSYLVSKDRYLDKKINEWKESKYVTETDLRDLYIMLTAFFADKVKKGDQSLKQGVAQARAQQQQQPQQPAQQPAQPAASGWSQDSSYEPPYQASQAPF